MQRVTTPAAVADLSKPFDLTNASEEQLSAHEPILGSRATGSGDDEHYSRTPVDLFEMGESWSPRLEIYVGGPPQMQRHGTGWQVQGPADHGNELK